MQLKVSITEAGYDNSAVISDIQFDLREGQLLAVIGPNGSGKTTLIRAISHVLPKLKGHIHINGTDLALVNEVNRARLMAVVPQSTYVPPSFLVEEVVLMGRTPYLNWNGRETEEDKYIVSEVLKQTDLSKYSNHLCGDLSSGERQRVILARALAQDTPVLLMDEPTSHLDMRYQIELLEMARSLSREGRKTVLIAMHDLNLAARFGDVFLAMKNGRTAAYGNANEILRPETLSSIYGLPIEVTVSGKKKHTIITPL